MGYYISLTESHFCIEAQHLDEAYQRLCELNLRDDLKTGGSPRDDLKSTTIEGTPGIWFSWLDWDYPNQYGSAHEIFEAIGFEVETRSDGSLHIEGYDNKTGCQDVFLGAICDLARGSLTWRGEDGEMWRDVFGEEAVRSFPGITTFGGKE